MAIGALTNFSSTAGTEQRFHDMHVVELANDGADGNDGSNGNSSVVVTVYQRAASQPSTPASDSASYNFSTNTLTPPSGWTASPGNGTNPLWSTTATFSVSGTSGTDSNATWSTPIQVDNGQPLTVGDIDPIVILDFSLSGDAEAGLQVNADGDLYERTDLGGAYSSIATWRGNGAAGEYQVMLQDNGASTNTTPTGNSIDQWLDCDTTRAWNLIADSNNSVQFQGFLLFREKASKRIVSSVSVFLGAEET